jgi:hypothetical protein
MPRSIGLERGEIVKYIYLVLPVLLTACASYSGIVPEGNNTYVVTKQQATGFPGLGNLKTELLIDAKEFCDKTGRSLRVLDDKETQPPYILGNYPRVELTFTCDKQ